MSSLHYENVDLVFELKKKQEQILPLAINEMYLNCRPITEWVELVFLSDKLTFDTRGSSYNLNYNIMFLYLDKYSLEWKDILKRIVKTIQYLGMPLTNIFPEKDHKYIQQSISFLLKTLSKIDKPELSWLHTYFQFFKLNFNNYQYSVSCS